MGQNKQDILVQALQEAQTHIQREMDEEKT